MVEGRTPPNSGFHYDDFFVFASIFVPVFTRETLSRCPPIQTITRF